MNVFQNFIVKTIDWLIKSYNTYFRPQCTPTRCYYIPDYTCENNNHPALLRGGNFDHVRKYSYHIRYDTDENQYIQHALVCRAKRDEIKRLELIRRESLKVFCDSGVDKISLLLFDRDYNLSWDLTQENREIDLEIPRVNRNMEDREIQIVLESSKVQDRKIQFEDDTLSFITAKNLKLDIVFSFANNCFLDLGINSSHLEINEFILKINQREELMISVQTKKEHYVISARFLIKNNSPLSNLQRAE